MTRATTGRPAPQRPRSHGWLVGGVVLVLVAAVMTVGELASQDTSTLQQPVPSAFPPQTNFYVSPDTSAAEWVRQHPGDPRAAGVRQLAAQPQADWLDSANPAKVRAETQNYVAGAAAQNAVPTLVAYAIPNRDCGGASSGGVRDTASYRNWIDNVVQGLGDNTAVVVLEPDSLANIDCLKPTQQKDRFAALHYAAHTIREKDPYARVYFDGGNSDWESPNVMASRLERAGVNDSGNGIALNVSNFNKTTDETKYGYEILRRLPNKRLSMVVDTSRNGNGPTSDHQYCDPTGRRIGTRPTAATGKDRVDAYLWIKHPGQADGCRGSAGDFMPDLAFGLTH